MRTVWITREDFGLFHQDISPLEYQFFCTHSGAFKRMWHEQTQRFWHLFVNAFDFFLWNHGVMKDFPMTEEESREFVDDILSYIRAQFVDGRFAAAKALIMDCVVVAQNRNCIALLEKAKSSQSPFVMKETREVFRQLFGPPTDRKTFMKVLCGLPVYVKFAGAAVSCLRRWLTADEIPSDRKVEEDFLSALSMRSRFSGEDIFIGYNKDALMKTVNSLKPPPSTTRAFLASTTSSTITIGKVKARVFSTTYSEIPIGKQPLSTNQALPPSTSREEDKKEEKKEEKEEKKEMKEVGKSKKKKRKKKRASEKTEKEEEVVVEGPKVGQEENIKPLSEEEKESKTSINSSPISSADSGIGIVEEDVTVETPTRLEPEERLHEKPAKEREEPVGERESVAGRGGGGSGEKGETRRRKLHICSGCGVGETIAKTFKRCQRCRGLPNPNYYCSRECQAMHWKEHRLDHREDKTASN